MHMNGAEREAIVLRAYRLQKYCKPVARNQ